MQEKRTEIWSCGGGVQSSAIAAMICRGELPRPDMAVMIDTEREKSKVWDYVAKTLKPALQVNGVELHIIKKSEFSTVDLWRNSDCLLPAYTDLGCSEIGKLPTYCSNEWKTRVMQRWATSKGVKRATIWLGISIDEAHRMRFPLGKWQHRYPLIEARHNRHDCRRLTHEMQWPDAPRSSCWMCPNMSHQQWIDMKNDSPEDFKRAVELEKQIRQKDPSIFLHRDGVPLEEVDWSTRQEDLFGGCNSGYCFT